MYHPPPGKSHFLGDNTRGSHTCRTMPVNSMDTFLEDCKIFSSLATLLDAQINTRYKYFYVKIISNTKY